MSFRLRSLITFVCAVFLLGAVPAYAVLTSAPAVVHVSLQPRVGATQLVFTWDGTKVPFSYTNFAGHLNVHFAKPVTPDWGSSLRHLPEAIKDIRMSGNQDLVVKLRHSPEVRAVASGIELVSKQTAKVQRKPTETLKTAARKRPVKQAKFAKKSSTVRTLALPATTLASLSPSAGEPEVALPAAVEAAPVAAVDTTTLAPAEPTEPTPPAPPVAVAPTVINVPIKDSFPAAVFIKNNMLWIVADKVTGLAPEKLHVSQGNPDALKELKSAPAKDAVALYMPIASDVNVSVLKHAGDGEMHVRLQPGEQENLKIYLPSLRTENNQSSLSVHAGTSETLLTFSDPLTGEELKVIPSSEAGAGIKTGNSFVDFALLPSAQGVVIQKKNDDLNVAVSKGLVTVSRPKTGLTISPEVLSQFQDKQADALKGAGNVLFPYARWKLEDPKEFIAAQERLFLEISVGNMEAANKARLKLLGLYLSEGLFPEALGVSDNILRSSYKFYIANRVGVLRGAAHFFMYRIRDAEHDFSTSGFDTHPEVKMWLMLCRILLTHDNEDFDLTAYYEPVIQYYPPIFIQKLAVISADLSINRKEYERANAIFDLLKRDKIDAPVKKYIDYMRAKIFSENKNEEEATKIWEAQGADVDDPLIRARAEFSLVNMLLHQGKITSEEAIKRLEKLRIVWRGDSLELNVLSLLGNLYMDDRQYGKALRTFRDIVVNYPEVPEAIITAQKMELAFINLYNKGAAESLPPLEALSLFYEFRDLVPPGRDGDQMIRNLADRLVKIDLLDRAALLLDHQIRKRLQSAERSQVGAQLALIYLLNHQPKEALETLKTTGYGDLPPALQLTRLRLTAQALAEENQPDKAIAVLSADNSPEGALQRLSIYWDNKDWANVITTAEELLGNRNDPSATLNAQESDVLIKLATAYVYEHDMGQIQYLRDYFTPLMKAGPNKDSFLFITSESGVIDYDNLANLEQDITTVKSFLDMYRDKVKRNGLSNTL